MAGNARAIIAAHDAGFGPMLRARRKAAGLSQEDLAQRSGLSPHTISNLERNSTRWPYRDTLQRLADGLELGDEARAAFMAGAARRITQTASDALALSSSGRPEAGLVPRQLPATVPAFAGRQRELASLSELLASPDAMQSVAVLAGTAGTGKTTLAVHWAHRVAAEFPDGQLFMNLRGFGPGSPVRPEHAVRAFLEALGVSAALLPATPQAQLGQYRSLLAGKRVLLVLDNALDEAQVRPLLPGSPACRVVVTSRNRLTGLVVTAAARPLYVDTLTSAGALDLLRLRLGEDRIAADMEATASIIRATAGLPLALCTVAARAATHPELPLTQLAADVCAAPGLDAFSSSADKTADIRTQLSWSYRQLDAQTARAFRLASLHPGTDLDKYAVAALSGGDLDQASRTLSLLEGACLVQPAGPGRDRMNDLLRRYAGELAAWDSDQARDTALSQLFDYYLHTASAARDALFPARRDRFRGRPWIAPPRTPMPPVADPASARRWLSAEFRSLTEIVAFMARSGWPVHAGHLTVVLAEYVSAQSRAITRNLPHGQLGRPRRPYALPA